MKEHNFRKLEHMRSILIDAYRRPRRYQYKRAFDDKEPQEIPQPNTYTEEEMEKSFAVGMVVGELNGIIEEEKSDFEVIDELRKSKGVV